MYKCSLHPLIVWYLVVRLLLQSLLITIFTSSWCTWHNLYGKVYLIQFYDKVYLIQLYDKVYLIQLLWQCVLDTSIARFIWYDQGVLDTTSMERCIWNSLYDKVHLIQPLWKDELNTSMARCTWYNLYGKVHLYSLWQDVLDMTSMAMCTWYNLYGKVH